MAGGNYYDVLDSEFNPPTMKKPEALALAREADPRVTKIVNIQSIARLWAGMGSIEKLSCNDGIVIIAKRIRCPANPRSFGDKRKAASYVVEKNFYANHANQLGNICCRGLHCCENDGGGGNITILMTPLPNPTLHYMSGDSAKAAVRSVATLHARYWGETRSSEAVETGGLAPQGTYWYLDTRPDEFDNMSRRGLEGKLKNAARDIDEALKAHPYQTIVHGDLKACNMSLSDDPRYVTFCDFQYIGRACPAKDLAYLFVCGMEFEESMEEDMLKLYLEELKNKTDGDDDGFDDNNAVPTLEGLSKALDLAYCDLYRWMCGWGVWGNGFLEDRVERCLDGIIQELNS